MRLATQLLPTSHWQRLPEKDICVQVGKGWFALFHTRSVIRFAELSTVWQLMGGGQPFFSSWQHHSSRHAIHSEKLSQDLGVRLKQSCQAFFLYYIVILDFVFVRSEHVWSCSYFFQVPRRRASGNDLTCPSPIVSWPSFFQTTPTRDSWGPHHLKICTDQLVPTHCVSMVSLLSSPVTLLRGVQSNFLSGHPLLKCLQQNSSDERKKCRFEVDSAMSLIYINQILLLLYSVE